MIAQGTGRSVQVFTRRRDHPALPGRDGLARVKAEATYRTERARMAPVIPGAQCAGGILNHPEAMLTGHVEDRVEVSAQSEQVNWDDANRSRRDQSLDLARVDIERPQIHVAEDRRGAHVLHHVGRGDPRERRHNDFVTRLQPQCCDRDVQSRSAGTDGDGKRRAGEAREFLLEVPDVGPLHDPAALQRLEHGLLLRLVEKGLCDRDAAHDRACRAAS